MRLAPATLVLVGLFGSAAVALARPPPCFPERTVMWAAELKDEHGRVFGGVRAGQPVLVLDDQIGDGGAEALVEIRTPVLLRGRVKRDRLLVFAGKEIPIEKDWSWWVAAAPLWILDGDDSSARINGAEPHGTLSSMPDVNVICAQLRSSPPGKIDHSACHGASHRTSSRQSGTSVFWPAGTTLTGPGGQTWSLDHSPVGVLQRNGDRVFVDVISWDWYRVRGWAPAAQMRPVPRDVGYGRGHGCCEGAIHLIRVDESPLERRLRAPAPLHASVGGEEVTRLPRASKVIQVGRLGDQALVLYQGRASGGRWTTVELLGWIPQSTLPGPPRLPETVRGRIVFPPGVAPLAASELIVELTSERLAHALPGRVAPDLAFQAPAVLAGEHTIKVRTRDGRWWGQAPSPAGKATVDVTMNPARAITGRILTDDGLSVPSAQVSTDWDQQTRTDATGRFQLLLHDDSEPVLSASAPGFQTRGRSLGQVDHVVLKLPRRRLLAGGVGQTAAGACAETEIVEERSVLSVSADCSFATDWDAHHATSLHGRRQRSPVVDVSPRGGRSTSGACLPDVKVKGAGQQATKNDVRCDVASDLVDICLAGPCARPTRGSLFVRISRAPDRLVPDAQVRVRSGDQDVGSCAATSGACFVHQLPIDRAVSVEVVAPGAPPVVQPAVRLQVGVTELNVGLP